MIGIHMAVAAAFEAQLTANFSQPSPEDRAKVATAVTAWLAATRKRQTPDLEVKLAAWARRIDHLSKNFSVTVKDGLAVVCGTTGEAEETLELIGRGTAWFEGCHDPARLVLTAMIAGSAKSTR